MRPDVGCIWKWHLPTPVFILRILELRLLTVITDDSNKLGIEKQIILLVSGKCDQYIKQMQCRKKKEVASPSDIVEKMNIMNTRS